jgi:hypothetical protein
MKKIFLFICTASLLISCSEQDTGDVSRITNFPIFEVSGDETIFVNQGEAYTDPGAIATEGGVEIEYTTSVLGKYRGGTTLDTNVPDVYQVTYTAVNQDGFNATASRTVIVYNTGDFVNSIEGLYTSTVFRNGVQGAPASNYTNIEYILIWKNGDGTYELSDGFGGWYEFGRALGAGYRAPGAKITVNNIATNSFSFGPAFTNETFGGTANITGVTANVANRTLAITVPWQADAATLYNFAYTLTQVQP